MPAQGTLFGRPTGLELLGSTDLHGPGAMHAGDEVASMCDAPLPELDGYLGTVTFFDRRAKMRLPAVRLYSNSGNATCGYPMVLCHDDRRFLYKEWLDMTRQRLRVLPPAHNFGGWWKKDPLAQDDDMDDVDDDVDEEEAGDEAGFQADTEFGGFPSLGHD